MKRGIMVNNKFFRFFTYNLIFVIEYFITFYYRYRLKEVNEITVSSINFRLLILWLVTFLTICFYEIYFVYLKTLEIKSLSVIFVLAFELLFIIAILIIVFNDINVGLIKTQDFLLKLLKTLLQRLF